MRQCNLTSIDNVRNMTSLLKRVVSNQIWHCHLQGSSWTPNVPQVIQLLSFFFLPFFSFFKDALLQSATTDLKAENCLCKCSCHPKLPWSQCKRNKSAFPQVAYIHHITYIVIFNQREDISFSNCFYLDQFFPILSTVYLFSKISMATDLEVLGLV